MGLRSQHVVQGKACWFRAWCTWRWQAKDKGRGEGAHTPCRWQAPAAAAPGALQAARLADMGGRSLSTRTSPHPLPPTPIPPPAPGLRAHLSGRAASRAGTGRCTRQTPAPSAACLQPGVHCRRGKLGARSPRRQGQLKRVPGMHAGCTDDLARLPLWTQDSTGGSAGMPVTAQSRAG